MRQVVKNPDTVNASEWASLSVHVFPIVLHAGHSVRLTPLYRLKLLTAEFADVNLSNIVDILGEF